MQKKSYVFIILHIFIALLFLSSTAALAGKKIVEDWETAPALDASWGNVGGNDHRVYIQNGELNTLVRPYSASENGGDYMMQARVRFPSSHYTTMTKFQTTVRLENKCDPSADTQFEYCAAGFSGLFYNTNASPADGVGDVFFLVRFGDRGNGLEVWYEVLQFLDADYETYDTYAQGTILPSAGLPHNGSWNMNQDYTLTVTYDDDKQFSGSFGGVAFSVDGPEKGDAPAFAGKWFRARIELTSPFSGDPDTSALHAVFDDVQTALGAAGLSVYDDFNGADEALSTSKWDSNRLVRDVTVTNNRLKLYYKTASTDTVSSSGVSLRARLPDVYASENLIQADMEITDGVTPDAARSELRLEGSFGNGKYSTHPGNSDGEIFATVRIRKAENTSDNYGFGCSVSMCETGNCISYTDFNWNAFGRADPDTVYTALLKKSGTVFTCQVTEKNTQNMIVSSSIDLSAQGVNTIYPVGEFKQLRARLRHAPGAVQGYFDNIKIGKASSLLLDIIPILSTNR